jgi:hypothetical protein
MSPPEQREQLSKPQQNKNTQRRSFASSYAYRSSNKRGSSTAQVANKRILVQHLPPGSGGSPANCVTHVAVEARPDTSSPITRDGRFAEGRCWPGEVAETAARDPLATPRLCATRRRDSQKLLGRTPPRTGVVHLRTRRKSGHSVKVRVNF